MQSQFLESLTSEALLEMDHLGVDESVPKRARVFDWWHFKAVLFRRWILFRRSVKLMVVTFLMTLFFTMLAIVCYYLMETLIHTFTWPMDFTFLVREGVPNPIAIGADDDGHEHLPFLENLADIFREDTGMEPVFVNYSSLQHMNAELFKHGKDDYTIMGVGFNGYYPYYNFTAIYKESTLFTFDLAAEVLVNRMVWKTVLGKQYDFKFTVTWMLGKLIDIAYAQAGPCIFTVGFLSIIPMFVTQPITDIRGEVRQYMVNCNLSLLPYWVAAFIIDICVWEVMAFLMWGVFLAFRITAFLDNKLNIIYTLCSVGPCFVLFTYCLSFTCSSPESASRQLFVILCVVMVLPVIVDIGRMNFVAPVWLDYLYGLVPHILMQRALAQMFLRINFAAEDLKYYWTQNPNVQGLFIMSFVDIPFYVLLLWVIERMRIRLSRSTAEKTYNNYTAFFADEKAKHPVTDEVRDLEDLVHSGVPFAVKVVNVSRLYFNTEGNPISAVNDVTLGVKEGQLFGFLGANGAGKTTLINMIMSKIPASNGTIEVNGVDIAEHYDPTAISVCPQFNTHLCYEMTPREHFYLYSLLHHYDANYYTPLSEKLMTSLDLMKFADKPVRELSGGNMRKLAIALAFYSPASIILLDEPTSSLDPVARHCVHELILSSRGTKTFMLCTHLLSEAESLCDVITIMIKGCIYTFGTPQYLSQKFGTELKIDIMLDDDSEESYTKCDNFFAEHLPLADLTISRPKARIYAIPASAISLPDLFDIMGAGKKGDNGFSYYTCSSSSLERVFMEIIRLSEQDENQTQICTTTLQSRYSQSHTSKIDFGALNTTMIQPADTDVS